MLPSWCGTADEIEDGDTTGVPQIPQNFSVPVIGLWHDVQTGRDAGGARGWTWGTGD